MKLIIEKSVVVITPTIGSPKLADAIESVARQTYRNVKHLLVLDGTQHLENFNKNLIHQDKDHWNLDFIFLPYNTGKTGGDFYGHRIYAGVPHLVNADYVFFLDEDNWYEPDHIKTMVQVLDTGVDFAYSLRKIFTPDKQYVCDDNCEALGRWPIFFTHNNPQFLVDTSAFAFERTFLEKTSHLWHSGWGGDRKYLYSVMDRADWAGSNKHTLCYRLDGNPGSVDASFFIKGNAEQLAHYNGELPWQKT